MSKLLTFILILSLVWACSSAKISQAPENYSSERLVLQKIGNQVYQHTSFLNTESFGRVGCNGMIVFDQNEAIIFDTPADKPASEELIDWVENKLKCKIKAIVPTHFHADCLGGLEVFHTQKVPSYANNLTLKLAQETKVTVPQNGFDNQLELKIGNEKIVVEFMGEGHTKDNVIGYFPAENAMFGGCLIKELGASKGYLGDANVQAWSETVRKIKAKYPKTKIVVPGHGKAAGTDLLDYTIKMFEQK